MNDTDELKFRCHICDALRLHNNINVRSVDVSTVYNLKPKTMNVNVSYCNDNSECIDKAEKYDYEKQG